MEITPFIFHSSYMPMPFVLTGQWKPCMKQTQSFLFYFFYIHILPILSTFGWLLNKETLNHGLPCLFLSFCVIIFSICGWLIQGSNTSKKGFDGFLGFPCFVSVLEASSVFNSSLSEVPHHRSTRILCLWTIMSTMHERGDKIWRQACCMHFLCSSSCSVSPLPHWTQLKKHKFKDKVTKNWKKARGKH